MAAQTSFEGRDNPFRDHRQGSLTAAGITQGRLKRGFKLADLQQGDAAFRTTQTATELQGIAAKGNSQAFIQRAQRSMQGRNHP